MKTPLKIVATVLLALGAIVNIMTESYLLVGVMVVLIPLLWILNRKSDSKQ